MLSDSTQEKMYVYEASRPLLKEQRLAGLGFEIGALLAIITGALGLRLYNLTTRSIWLDEATDLLLAQQSSFSETLTLHQAWNNHPPLFYPILHLLLKFVGFGEFGLRFFSVVVGLLTIILIYFTVRHWLNQRIAFISALLLAVAPIHLFWSQSIRPYAWLTLLVAITMSLGYYVSEKPQQNWRWLLFGLSCSILIYTHYLGFHLVFSAALFLLISLYKDWRAILRLGITLALVALSFIPYFANFLEQSKFGSSSYLTSKSPTQFLEMIETLSSWFIPQSYTFLAGAIFLPLYLLGLIWLWQNYRKQAILLGFWSFLPVVTSWVSSMFRPNFSVRYLSFCGPAFLVIIAAGIWSLPSQKVLAHLELKVVGKKYLLPYILLVLAIALNLISDLNYNRNYTYQDWRSLVNYIVANQQEGDVVFLANPDNYTHWPFDFYYVDQLGSPGNLSRRYVSQNVTDQEVANVFKNTNRVWVVTLKDSSILKWTQEKVRPRFPENFKLSSQKIYPSTQSNIDVELFVKTP